jgi:hypothetical protein
MSKLLKISSIALLGIASGVVGALLVTPPSVHVPLPPSPETARAAPAAAGVPAGRERHVATPPADPEQARAQTIQRWHEQLQAHEIEPRDAAWANATGPLFEDDLRRLGERERFELVSSQCRTNTCSAIVQWPDYGAALEHYASLLHNPYQIRCARKTLLPEPEHNDAPYRATVLFDCSRTRS